MKYIITDGGIQFFDDAEAVEIVKAIAERQREALEHAIRTNAAATVDNGTPADAPAAAAA